MKMKFVFAAFAALFVAWTAQAATRTWTGGGDGITWSDAENWGGTVPSGSDVMTFPADKGCTITLPTGDLTGSGAFTVSGDYVFQAPAGQERGSATWTIGGKITLNASSSLTFKNLKVNNSTGTAWALSGDLSLVNTEMSISSSSTIDGVTVSLTDSIFTVGSSSSAKNLSFKESSSAKPTMLLVDNSTIRVSGAFPNAVSGGTVSFSGKAPRLIVRGAFKGVDSNFIHLIFNVPEDGYDGVPLTVAGSNAFPVNGFASFEVDPDSAVFASGFDGVVPLVASVYYIRNEWSGKSGSTKGATYLLPSEDFLSALAEAGGAFEYRYCTSVPAATDPVITDGEIPDELTWTTTRSASDHIHGVYIKGVPGAVEPKAPTLGDTIAAASGTDGKSFSATVAVMRLGSGDSPEVFLQYRESGASAWTDAGTNLLSSVGDSTFDIVLPSVVSTETVYELQAFSRVTAGGTNYVSVTPATGSVTIAPPSAFTAFAADGSAGDAIAVRGTMGIAGSVVLEVSTAADFSGIHASYAVGTVAAEGSFAHTFHETETTAPGYIKPGMVYYVRAVATVDDSQAVSDVVVVTTPAGSTAAVSTFTHSGATVSLAGTLDPKGAGTTEVHILWCSDAQSFDTDVTVATIGPDDAAGWTWTTTLASADTLFCYKIYTKNTCSTEQWQTEPVLGKGSELPTDQSALFKWVADEKGELSGAWTDRNHWKPYRADGTEYTGVRLDYPDQDPDADPKAFDFSALEGREAVISLPPTTVRWGVVTNFPGAANATITFEGTPGSTTIVRSNPTANFTFAHEGSTLIFDGVRFEISANVLLTKADSALVLQNQTVFKVTGKLNLGTESPSGTAYSGNILLIVDDATLDMSGGSKNRCIWGSVKMSNPEDKTATVIVRGKHPKLLLSGLADCGGDGKILFNIPNGGYAETPIVFAGASDAQRLPYREETSNQGKALRFLVDRESEAIWTVDGKNVDCTLVDWKNQGIDTEKALLDSDGEKVRVAPGTTLRCFFDTTLGARTISVRIAKPWAGVLIGLHGVGKKPGTDPDDDPDDDPGKLPTVSGDWNVSVVWSQASVSNQVPTCMLLATESDTTAASWQAQLNALGVTTARIQGALRQGNPAACGQRAARLVRAEAAARGVNRLGILADTSGSRLALLLATSSQTPAYEATDEKDALASYIDFALVDSPEDFVQGGSTNVTLVSGDQEEPNAALVPDFRFDEKTCPIWIAQSTTAGPGRYWTANLLYRKMKIFLGKVSEIHLYGPHESGARIDRATEFMKQIGMLGDKGSAVSLMNVHTGDDDRGGYEKEYIWPAGTIPAADGTTFESVEEANRPYIEWHLPKVKTTDAILIVYSGGSYSSSQPDSKEVAPVRRRLNELGMTVVTLHYRALGHDSAGHVRAWQDVQRAIRLVRSKAASKGLDPDRIGIMGSSAGGHMTLAVATGSKTDRYAALDDVDTLSAAPQWAVAVYPAYVISGSCNTSRIAPVTTDFHFDEQTPPFLFMHGDADTWPSMGSVKSWEKLQRNGVEAELHIFAQNGHTFMTSVYPGTGAYNYIDRVWDFLTAHGFNQ